MPLLLAGTCVLRAVSCFTNRLFFSRASVCLSSSDFVFRSAVLACRLSIDVAGCFAAHIASPVMAKIEYHEPYSGRRYQAQLCSGPFKEIEYAMNFNHAPQRDVRRVWLQRNKGYRSLFTLLLIFGVVPRGVRTVPRVEGGGVAEATP